MSVTYLEMLPMQPAEAEIEDRAIYVCRGGCDCSHDGGPCSSCVRLCEEPNATSTAAKALGCAVWGAGVAILA